MASYQKKGRKWACPLWCHVLHHCQSELQPINDDKCPWLLQGHLTRELMLTVPFPFEIKARCWWVWLGFLSSGRAVKEWICCPTEGSGEAFVCSCVHLSALWTETLHGWMTSNPFIHTASSRLGARLTCNISTETQTDCEVENIWINWSYDVGFSSCKQSPTLTKM